MSSDRPRTLSEWLRGRPDEWLAALLRARPDLAVPVPGDLGVLASRIGIRVSVGRALEDLDAFTLQVLDGLLLSERTSSYADVRALLPAQVPDGAVHGAIDRLRDLAIVWGDNDELHLVVSVRELASPYPAGLGHPVGTLLRSLTDMQVAPILHTLDLPDRRQPEASQAIAGRYADASWLHEQLAGCGDAERAVLAHLGQAPLGQLPGAQRPWTPEQNGSPVRSLLARALLVAVGPDTVELPREVGMALREDHPLGPSRFAPPELAPKTMDLSTVDRTAAGQVLIALRQVEDLLQLMGAETPGVLRAGGLGTRELRRIAKVLDQQPQELALWLEICHSAGLLDRSPSIDSTWQPTRSVDAWLVRSPELRWTALATAWLGMSAWPGLVGERDERDKPVNALSYEVTRMWSSSVRHRALGVLAELPAGSALPAEAVVEQLVWRTPRRAVTGRVEIVRTVLAEGEQLGLLGRGALSRAGRSLLAGRDDVAKVLGAALPEPVDHVLIQADLTVVAPGPLTQELAREIALVADVESSGGATVYRIDERSVRRALDAGRSAGDLHALFEARSRTPVPQALRYLVDDVARRHGRLRVGSASAYLRCDDESVLTELVADRRTGSLGLRRLAPTIVTSTSPVPALLEVLRGAGYAPVAEDPSGAVVISRADSKRLPARAEPVRPGATRPTDDQLIEAIRKLRAGDDASRSARRSPVTTWVPGVTTAGILELLQQADVEGLKVWLGYVDSEGSASQRVIEVEGLAGGFLQAFDQTAGGHRTFALHRITSAALLDPVD